MQITGIQSSDGYQRQVKSSAEDAAIKNARQQIEALNKQLQALSENEDMDPKTKSEKKQELQKQISDLNTQIRQREIELRREKQEAMPTKNNRQEKAEKSSGGFSQSVSDGLISVSNALKGAKALHGLGKRLSGRAGELNAEIKADLARGADTAAKEKELEKVNKGIKSTAEESIKMLGAAKKELDTSEKEDDEVKTDGMYDKEGNRVEDKDDTDREYDDKA